MSSGGVQFTTPFKPHKEAITSSRQPSPASARITRRRSSVNPKFAAAQEKRKPSSTPQLARRQASFFKGRLNIFLIVGAVASVLALTGIIIGAVLSRKQTAAYAGWRPANGTTWQIELNEAVTTLSNDAEVYTIDLYSNLPSTIASLHALNRKVICYFSAGTYEDDLADHVLFDSSSYSNAVDGLENNWWLDTRSSNVRSVMKARLDLAVAKGCDGVDPDHMDGYNFATGFPLSQDTALQYLDFLSTEAHQRNLSIGLVNSGELSSRALNLVQWQTDENCELFDCSLYQPFLQQGKPVFHIIYSSQGQETAALKQAECSTSSIQGFSTIFKNTDLDSWVDRCS